MYAFDSTSLWKACISATYAPVIAAVLVPPSALITSQSTVNVRSPSRSIRATERNERPIKRWISAVRPDVALRSRDVRVCVDRGSIEYSAVIQPEPVPTAKRGSRSSVVAAQSTVVPPIDISAEPSACAR